MIEALIGLVGVVVGSVITISKDVWISWFERQRNGSFAAMRIIGVLDQFVETCVDVVSDNGTVQGQYAGRTEQGEEYLIAQVALPTELSFPDDIDWKSIGGELMYRVLALPSEVKKANRYIDASSDNAFPPDYEEVFDARHQSYADLGLEALEIARLIRKGFHIPDQKRPAWNPDWDPKVFFMDQKKKKEERQEHRAASYAQMQNAFQEKSGIDNEQR